MKKLSFYYRSREAIDIVFENIEGVSNNFDKALINYFVLKSATFRKCVDEKRKISVGDVAGYLKKEKMGIKAVVRVFIKVILHWCFLLYAGSKKNTFNKIYKNVLKSYVEVEYDLFRSKTENTNHLVLVFPFPLSFKRQFNYIKSLRKTSLTRNMRFSLYGMPYSIIKLARILIARNLFSVFILEYEAANKFAGKLSRLNFETLLNMDDFEPMSVIYHDALREEGRYVDTHLHGIGTYAPFISTDHLRTFNKLQKSYYGRAAHISEFSYYEEYLREFSEEQVKKKVDAIVFYSQIMRDTLELSTIEERVIIKIKEIANDNKIKFIYKKHPNLTNIHLDYLNDIEQFTEKHKALWHNMRTVGISFYSTTYYTEKHDYSVLVEVPEIPVRLLFSDDHLIVSETDLISLLEGDK